MLRNKKPVNAISILKLKTKLEEKKQAEMDRIFRHKKATNGTADSQELSKRSLSGSKVYTQEDKDHS
jgi:hypothetical protein